MKKMKKLVLNRETLRVLDASGLTKIAGGLTNVSCNTTCPASWDCAGSALCSAGCTAAAGCQGTNNCGSYTRTTIEN